MTSPLVEGEDRWHLPLAGRKVERLCVDYSVTLLFNGSLELRIEQPFVITRLNGVEALIVPDGDSERLAPVVHLTHQKVAKSEAFKDGRLELTFADGTTLAVPADEGFEAWELVGPDGLRTISLPGGDLAVWMPEAGES